MKRPIQRNNDLHGNVPDHHSVALLLVDVLNDFDFPDAGKLLKKAPKLAKNISGLKLRCRQVGIPAIYVNDNRGKWRSDASGLINHCLNGDAPGRALIEPLVPLSDDYIVLKPKHSAFYATPLDALLSYLQARTIILVGLTTDACILTTACEIHIRDLNLYVPSDCVAASEERLHAMAIELMRKSFDAHTMGSRSINLRKLRNPSKTT
jgi:nicotinamidase-related amidase